MQIGTNVHLEKTVNEKREQKHEQNVTDDMQQATSGQNRFNIGSVRFCLQCNKRNYSVLFTTIYWSLWLIGTVRAEPEMVTSRAWVQSPDRW